MIEILIGVVVILGVIYFLSEEYTRKDMPPGPRGLPIFGSILEVGNKPHLKLTEWYKKYGPIYTVKLGSTRMVVVSDPKMAKQMFGHDPNYTGKINVSLIYDMFEENKPYGLVHVDGENWDQLRRFTVRQLREFGFGKKTMEENMIEEVSDVLDWLKTFEGRPVQGLKDRLSLSIVSTLWTMVNGSKARPDDPELIRLCRGMAQIMKETTEKGSAILFLPWLRFIIPERSGYNGARRIMRNFREFFSGVVERHRKTWTPEYMRDYIDVFLQECKRNKDPKSPFYGPLSEKFLMGSVSDLFLAGSDTTSTSLLWAILYLAKFAEIQKKMQDEIEMVTNGNSRLCTLGDRPNMPYTEAVITECLRFSTVVPTGSPHRALSKGKFKGYTIPVNTAICVNLYWFHFDPSIWGDPENFRPERFLSEDGKTFKKNDAMNMFGFGKRMCIGEGVAKDALFLFVSNTFQRFQVDTVGSPSLEQQVGFVMHPFPFECTFIDRQQKND